MTPTVLRRKVCGPCRAGHGQRQRLAVTRTAQVLLPAGGHHTIALAFLLWPICAIFVRVLDPLRRESGRMSRVSTPHELKALRLSIR
jgi:hypothetical protein